ncbi:MAG: thermonuclease family protein [Bacillota bacterium]
MRIVIRVLLMGLMVTVLFACEASDHPVEPSELEGKTKDEMEPLFKEKDWEVEFQPRSSVERDDSNVFIEYGQVDESSKKAYVIVSATLDDEDDMFEPIDMEYEGPRLEEDYFDDSEWPLYEEVDGELMGGGGAFDSGYTPGDYQGEGGSCIDGDTTVFDYPEAIESRIESDTPSTRYFNVDTPETFSGGEEEWGFAATNFTCETLSDAKAVVLQTDPGDNLTGNYGRLLAWVWYIPEGEDDYELLNYNIVRQGLGTVEYEYGAGETGDTVYDGTNYNDWMHQAEDLAIEEELGMHNEDLRSPYWDYDTDSPKQD